MGRQRLEAGQLWAAGGDEKNSRLTSPAAPSDARAPLLASNSVFVSLLQIECHCRNISAVRVVACSEKVWFSYVTERSGSKQAVQVKMFSISPEDRCRPILLIGLLLMAAADPDITYTVQPKRA